MQVKAKLSAAGAIAGAAAMAFLGTGVANAAPALNAVPTANYQMCGTVYTGGSWVANAAPPSAATGVSGATVKGTLYNSGGTKVTDYSTTTDANGRYCIQGTSALVSTVTSGGYVKLETPGSGTTPANQWETAGIYESDFFDHLYTSIVPFITQSADQFHIVR
ncbi:hypothetical protein P9990_19715 [Prescottella equi]|uniref:hypothetical protein n=1 Tax=Rhodococcus hoagii TaxID=43767 RepID=UPI0025766AD7|nr:hypothetical protein [Prescottella equi]WJJ10782.1 hypothetical protein P9990_19715 [Prescottella equi]